MRWSSPSRPPGRHDSLALFNEAVTAGEQAAVPQAIESAAETGALHSGSPHRIRPGRFGAGRSAEIGVSTRSVRRRGRPWGELRRAVAVGGAVADW